jgi:hypothetical protein
MYYLTQSYKFIVISHIRDYLQKLKMKSRSVPCIVDVPMFGCPAVEDVVDSSITLFILRYRGLSLTGEIKFIRAYTHCDLSMLVHNAGTDPVFRGLAF